MPDPDPTDELDQTGDGPVSRLEELVALIFEKLNDATVDFRFGRKYLKRHGTARRVTWVPAGGRIESSRQAGGRPVTTDTGTFRARSIRTRVERVEAHIYAESFTAAEELLDAIIAATDLAIPTVEWPGDHAWPSEVPVEAGETLRTSNVVRSMAFRLPVLEEVQRLAPIASTAVDGGTLQNDGSTKPQD